MAAPSPPPGFLSSRRFDIGLRVALAALQIAALAWFAPNPLGLPLDDAWIHQVVGRTLAQSGTLGFAPGQHGAAATSYLWAILVGVNFRTANVSPAAWTFALNAIATLAIGQLLYVIFVRARPRKVSLRTWRIAIFLAAATTCTQSHVLWFAWSGMEASPFLALSLGAIALATAESLSPRTALYAGICAGALALLRPEAMPLGAMLAIYMYRRTGKNGAAAWAAAPWALAVLFYVGSNVAHTGHAMPSTLGGRRWLWFGSFDGMTNDQLVLEMLLEWSRRGYHYMFDGMVAVVFAAAGLALYGALRLVWEASDGSRFAFFWAACHVAFYVVMLPTGGHAGRYQPFVPLFFVFAAAMGTAFLIWDVTSALRAPKLRVVGTVAILGWAWLLWRTNPTFREANDIAVRHIARTEIGMGELVNELPDGSIVASFDIGGIAWASKKPIVDLGGLSDPDTARMIQEGRAHELLRKKNVTHVVLPGPYELDAFDIADYAVRLGLRENPALSLAPVRVLDSPYEGWQLGVAATWNAAPRQVLYAVTYTDAPGPRTKPALKVEARRPLQDPAGTLRPSDRAIVEHALAILAQWDVPVDLEITGAAPKDPPKGCRVAFGIWGSSADGCGVVGDEAVVRTMIAERVEPYLDAFDMFGASREVVHTIARVKRRSDPGFRPLLVGNTAPVTIRERSTERNAEWGIPFAVVVFFAGLLGAWAARSRGAALAAAVIAVSCAEKPDLLKAASEGPVAVEAALAAGEPVDRRGPGGTTALHIAAGRADGDSIARLVAHGADADAKDAMGNTPLHMAARKGFAYPLAILLHAAHDIDATSQPLERTPLHEAALFEEPAAVRALLAAGADRTRADSRGKRPLHLVAASDPYRAATMIPILLEGETLSKVMDARGFTALHAAAYADNATAIEHLADVSDIEAKTPAGESALDLALRYHTDRAAEALLRRGAISRKNPPLHEAARTDDLPRAGRAIGAGADASRLFEGKTALDVARESKSKRVEALLARMK